MKIAIDISPVLYGTGVSVYTKYLVQNLLKVDNENDYFLFGYSLRRKKELKDFIKTLDGNFDYRLLNIPPTLAAMVWNNLHTIDVQKLVGKTDIYHSSDWIEPPTTAKKITTVHDLAPFKFPKQTHPKILAVHKRKLAWVRDETEKIIVPSEATKQDLIEIGFDKKKITVVYEAVSDEFKPSDKKSVDSIKKKYKINNKYVLSVGINPRKNTERIIKAFEQVKAGKDLKLVLVGNPTFIDLQDQRDIRLLGHISTEELITLYSGAEVFVYPSLYEGFGIPILEAMACETPVVTSNISSMPEVAGDAAILVDPYSHDSIADGIKEAIRSKKKLIGKGKKNVKRFSWKKNAEETLKVYEEAIKTK